MKVGSRESEVEGRKLGVIWMDETGSRRWVTFGCYRVTFDSRLTTHDFRLPTSDVEQT